MALGSNERQYLGAARDCEHLKNKNSTVYPRVQVLTLAFKSLALLAHRLHTNIRVPSDDVKRNLFLVNNNFRSR